MKCQLRKFHCVIFLARKASTTTTFQRAYAHLYNQDHDAPQMRRPTAPVYDAVSMWPVIASVTDLSAALNWLVSNVES